MSLMTADELASPRYEGSDEALEAHRSESRPQGCDTVHHAPVWHDGAYSVADTTDPALAAIMLLAAASVAPDPAQRVEPHNTAGGPDDA